MNPSCPQSGGGRYLALGAVVKVVAPMPPGTPNRDKFSRTRPLRTSGSKNLILLYLSYILGTWGYGQKTHLNLDSTGT